MAWLLCAVSRITLSRDPLFDGAASRRENGSAPKPHAAIFQNGNALLYKKGVLLFPF